MSCEAGEGGRAGVTRLNLTVRRCRTADCGGYKKPYRPEAESSFALPRHEFGLDVVALIGRLRYAEHRPVPEIRAHLVGRKVAVRYVHDTRATMSPVVCYRPPDDRPLHRSRGQNA